MAAAPALTGPGSIGEAAGNATYTVSCGETELVPGVTVANTGALTVSAGPAGTAADRGDPAPALITCAVGATGTVATVEVPITNDTLDEGGEQFTVTVSGVLTGVVGPVALEFNTSITDDDPVASIAPVVLLTEGNSGTQTAQLVVTLASAAVQATTIAYSTLDFSAEAGSDYTATSGNLVIPQDQTTGTISIPVMGDTTPEGNEAFFVNLNGTSNGTLNPTKKQGAVGIFNDDTSPLPTVSIEQAAYADEGDQGTSNLLLNVTLSAAATERTEVKWKTANFTADKTDYDSANGKVVFQKGQKSKTVSVDVKGDTRDEPDEAFGVRLSSPVAAVLGTKKDGFGIIEDDDGPKMKIGKPRVRGKRLINKVGCPESADGCKGRLVAKSGKLKLGRKKFDLGKGEAKKLKLKLSRKARAALAERRRRAKLTATASDSTGDTRITTRKARLRRLR